MLLDNNQVIQVITILGAGAAAVTFIDSRISGFKNELYRRLDHYDESLESIRKEFVSTRECEAHRCSQDERIRALERRVNQIYIAGEAD